MFLGWAAICLVPVYVWTYLVAEPLAVTDPLNWRLLFSESVGGYNLSRGYVGGRGTDTVVMWLAIVPSILRHLIMTIINTLRNFVRFNQLPARVRAAVAGLASTPETPKGSTDTMPSNAAEAVPIISDYQPLNKRLPTRKILSPFASYFEALLALPGMVTVNKVVVGPRAS